MDGGIYRSGGHAPRIFLKIDLLYNICLKVLVQKIYIWPPQIENYPFQIENWPKDHLKY